MFKMKHNLVMGLALVMGLLVLAACNGQAQQVAEQVAPTVQAAVEEVAPTVQAAVEEVAPTVQAAVEEMAPTEEAAAGDEEMMEGSYLERARAGEFSGTTVDLMGVMVDEEAQKMEETVRAFEEQTGIDVVYEGTKEFETSINVRVDAGDPPDIANISQPGMLQRFVDAGAVADVSTFLSRETLQDYYLDSWLDMATMEGPDGPIMAGVWHRVSAKSMVFYPKKAFDAAGYTVPTTWDEMLELTQQIADDGDTAWCIGIESGAATGWVATDWVENIMLRTTSLENYDAWVNGDLPFASPEVKNAVDVMSNIWLNEDYVYGGPASIVSTYIGDSPVPMFQDPPGCWFHMQAAWITGFFGDDTLVAGEDYDFFYLPPIDEAFGRPVLVAGDMMAMFNDRPEVRALMEYFSHGEGVEEWVKLGGAISPHKDAQLDWYTTTVDRGVAELLQNATSVRFDASDLMPAEVGSGSFWKAMTDYISGATDLDTALAEVDASWPR
ncbi:MAG: extracellular solute-binding protein [Chloroflexota bacterium]